MNFLASKAQLRASFMRWALFLVPLIVLLGYLSGQFGSADTVWFDRLEKPAAFPPPATFGIVWTVLYVMIGLSLALVASAWGAYGRGLAIIVFALHFVGNLAWSPVFFGARDMVAALFVIGYMVLTLIVTIAVFWRVRRLAALLLLPYLGWVLFAGLLNYQFIEANPDGGSAASEGALERIEL